MIFCPAGAKAGAATALFGGLAAGSLKPCKNRLKL
jgi:hypothetical protein